MLQSDRFAAVSRAVSYVHLSSALALVTFAVAASARVLPRNPVLIFKFRPTCEQFAYTNDREDKGKGILPPCFGTLSDRLSSSAAL